MKEFLKNTGYFSVFAFIAVIILFNIVDFALNSKSQENNIFIWGDSQIFEGINLAEMHALTGKNILSAAKHGAGVYDLLVFADYVPEGATVVVALSESAQMRAKESDRNLSGISRFALSALSNANYSFGELWTILKKNICPTHLYLSKKTLFPVLDTLVLREPISVFEEIYAKEKDYLKDKQKLYKEGVQKLIDKHCDIVLLELPNHPFLEEVENKSPSKKQLNRLQSAVMGLFETIKLDSINIIPTKRMMYDLTHLNEYGATHLTRHLVDKMKNRQEATLYVVNNGVCE